jgi:hypothetical protein
VRPFRGGGDDGIRTTRASGSAGVGRRRAPEYDHGMAYDEALAERIRDLVGDEPGLSEQRMFGGLAS